MLQISMSIGDAHLIENRLMLTRNWYLMHTFICLELIQVTNKLKFYMGKSIIVSRMSSDLAVNETSRQKTIWTFSWMWTSKINIID